jgi:RNA polymerase sigma-70 factor, ECF subfamily
MTSTSHTLLLRLRRREDHGAWERFVVLYTPLLLRWTQRAGFAEQDAVDLVQDVFAILIVEMPRFEFDNSRGPFRAWLKTVTLNQCRDRQRKRLIAPNGGQDQILAELPGNDVLEALWETEYQEQILRRAMEVMQSQFEPKTWQAAWEMTANRLTALETGQKLGLSEAAVYVAKSRVLRRLRQELAGLLD